MSAIGSRPWPGPSCFKGLTVYDSIETLTSTRILEDIAMTNVVLIVALSVSGLGLHKTMPTAQAPSKVAPCPQAPCKVMPDPAPAPCPQAPSKVAPAPCPQAPGKAAPAPCPQAPEKVAPAPSPAPQAPAKSSGQY